MAKDVGADGGGHKETTLPKIEVEIESVFYLLPLRAARCNLYSPAEESTSVADE